MPAEDPQAKPKGKTIGDWVDRRGRPPSGFLTVDAAWRAVPEVMAAFERKVARRAAAEAREAAGGVSLGVGIERWLAARKLDDPEGRWEAWKAWKHGVGREQVLVLGTSPRSQRVSDAKRPVLSG